MKTIHIDLSNKNVLPAVYAKQADVGRKFAVIFTEAGAPYNIPNDAHLSVWYDGDSGDGNYTNIGDESAFRVNGNVVEVEMIEQMLSVPGIGNMCIVLANSEGEQIGSWNITYICEERPGFGSEGAKSYFNAFSEVIKAAAKFTVDKTLSKSGSPADAAATGSRIEEERERVINLVAENDQKISVERARINELVAMHTNDGSTRVDLSADGISGFIKTNGVHAYAQFNVKNEMLAAKGHLTTEYFIPREFLPFTSQAWEHTQWLYAATGTADTDKIYVCFWDDNEDGLWCLDVYNTSDNPVNGSFSIYGEYALATPYCNELSDIRAGYDGTTYETAGDATRAQFGKLNNELKKTATIDDAVVSAMTAWSSLNTVNKLCQSFVESGSAVRCEPVEGYPLEVSTELSECASAKLWHGGKNILNVSTAGMYHSNSATTQAVNNTVTETGVYMKPLAALSNPSQRCGLYIGTAKELAGKTITVSAKVETTISMPWMLITATQSEPTTVRENPTYSDGGYLSSNASKTLKETKATDGFAKITYTVTGAEAYPYINVILYLGNTGAVTTEDWTEWSDIQVEIGDTATAYEPYRGETYEVDFGEPVSGRYIWTQGDLVDENGAYMGYGDDPINVIALDGVNTIWCDSGETTVKGKSDPSAVIEKLTNAIIALGGNV